MESAETTGQDNTAVLDVEMSELKLDLEDEKRPPSDTSSDNDSKKSKKKGDKEEDEKKKGPPPVGVFAVVSD